MINRRWRSVLACTVLCAAGLALGTAPLAVGAPDDAPTGPKGSVFQSAEAGIRAQGPAGWRLIVDKAKSPEWTRLATFYDPKTNSDAVLSRRPRTARNVQALMGSVTKDWRASPELTISSKRVIDRSAVNDFASVVVDATFIKRRKAKDPNAPPPAPITYRISATYYLAPKSEILLYVKARATHWSRIRSAVNALKASVKLVGAASDTGPRGESAYRNDRHGFTCKYPKGYTVVAPARSAHVVQFEGLSAEQPVIGIYRIVWEAGVDKDVERLLTYYQEELAGEAETRSVQVAARQATLITARANVGGRDQTFFVAIMKRGGEIWRLKASVPRKEEGAGFGAFRAFLDTFRLGSTPR